MNDDQYDVIIVGAGAGGGASAWALSRYGFRVLLLDAGPIYRPRTDYRLHQADWERHRFPQRGNWTGRYSYARLQRLDPRRQDLRSWNAVSGRLNRSRRRLARGYEHVRGFGGSTLAFSGEAHRLDPAAMSMYSDYGVAADWPLDYAELEPFYGKAENIAGVAGPDEDPRQLRIFPYPLPAHPFGYASRRLQAGCARLGFDWHPNSLAILPFSDDGRPACNYCANCLRGCPRLAKGSADVTFIRKALQTGHCGIIPEACVIQIETGPRKIERVHFLNQQGELTSAESKIVVLAAGAVETPRLLLLSDSRYSPQGLCNEEGQVGQHFMEALAWTSCGLYPATLGSHRGVPADGVCWNFNAPDAIPGLLGGCRFFHATATADLLGPLNYTQRLLAGWGQAHKQDLQQHFGRALAVGAYATSLPNPRAYIDIDTWTRDKTHMPVARIHSHLTPLDVERLAFMAKTARDILSATGVQELLEETGNYDFFQANYVLGTCRMGADPRSSVVDGYGRSHRWPNLFITDASVLPSIGGGEGPVLTIQALALRTAQHIRDLIGRRAL